MSLDISYSGGVFSAPQAKSVGSFNPLNDDGYFERVTLLMHMDGDSGSTSFPDTSAYNQPTTASGNAQISTTASKFGGSSAYFDGDGDYITVNSGSVGSFLTQDFTVEAWINYTFSGSSETRMIVISGGQGSSFDYFQIAVSNNNSLRAEHRSGRGVFSTPANSLSPNTWHHIALVRDSTSTRFYIDGVEEASTTAWAGKILRTQAPATVTIGQMNTETGFDNEYPGEYFKGYIDEVRVTKGVARYTSTFTPDNLPFYKGLVTEFDLSSGNYFNYTPANTNTEFRFNNAPPANTASGFLLQLNGANGSETFTIADLTYDNISFSTSNEETSIKGLFWKPDGTKLYIVGFVGDDVNEYNCSTAYDITTATFNQAASVSGGGANPSGIVFRDDGLRFYTCRASAVDEFRLTTAWDVSTASYQASTSVGANAAVGLAFKPDGTRFFVCQGSQSNTNARKTLQYDLSTAWDITTSSYAGITAGNGPIRQTGMAVSNDGTRMFVSNYQGQLVSYLLTTPWDLTALASSASGSTSSEIGQCAISFSPDGSKFYAYQTSTVYQYSSSAVTTATFTYPSSVKFPNGIAPAGPAIGETDVLVFYTDDGGTTYQGFRAGNAMS
jgi:hypothetical protein